MSIGNSHLKGNVVMGVKSLPDVSDYVGIHTQSIRKTHITVEVLDNDNNVIDSIEGVATGGSISIVGESLIRRAGTIDFVYLDNLLPDKHSRLWITNKIRVYAGIENLSLRNDNDSKVVHFCLGTYYITDPQVSIDIEQRSISISLEDYMMKWEQTQSESIVKIESGTPLHIAVENVVNFHDEFNTDVQFTDLKVPYTLEYPIETTVLEILEDLRDLYMDWHCYYDVDGTFVFKRSQVQREDGEPVLWKFKDDQDLITSMSEEISYKGLKNRVVVYGSMNEKTGITPKSEVSIDNKLSPFHKDKIQERTLVIVDESYSDKIQCDSRARYELFKNSTFQERVNLTSLPIYYLDANHIIEIKSPSDKRDEFSRYEIDSIGFDLGIESEMDITCHKIYYDHFEIVGEVGDYRKSAEAIEDGIMNKGWLSLAEDRIKEFYGIQGSGNKLIIRFEYNELGGTTAYTTGYVGSTTQTITIDLADFNNPQGDSGDNGTGKAEYADRVLGHEMVHVVMNDSLSVKKTLELPHWFKEGMGELIHGADERLKLSIVKNGSIVDSSLKSIVQRAEDLANGSSWRAETDDYSASYLIVKFIDKRLRSGRSYKDIMSYIKSSNSNANESLKAAIENNTNFTTYQEFVTAIKNNLESFVRNEVQLNLGGDEIDTGSIGGSNHRGSKHLNAEDVFDNSKATVGLAASKFNVEINKPY